MLQFFRSNQVLLSVLLLAYAALLHLPYWVVEQPSLPASSGIGTLVVEQWLIGMPAWVEQALVLVCLGLQGGVANYFVMENRLARQVNLFPGLFIILCASLLPVFLAFSGYHLANIFVLLAMNSLAQVYRVSSAADTIFNVGFWIGVASLFQPHYLWFLLAAWGGLTVLRARKLSEATSLLFGMFAPWLLVGFGYFWFDQFNIFWSAQWTEAFSWPQYVDVKLIPMFELLILAILLLWVLFSYRGYQMKTTMEVQKRQDLLYWFLLAGGLTAIFAQPWHMLSWLAVVPYIGVLLSFNFTNMSKRAAEAWHLLLLLFFVGLHFHELIFPG